MPTKDHKVIWLNMTPAEHAHLQAMAAAGKITLTNLMRDALGLYCEKQGAPLEFPHSVAGRPRGE